MFPILYVPEMRAYLEDGQECETATWLDLGDFDFEKMDLEGLDLNDDAADESLNWQVEVAAIRVQPRTLMNWLPCEVNDLIAEAVHFADSAIRRIIGRLRYCSWAVLILLARYLASRLSCPRVMPRPERAEDEPLPRILAPGGWTGDFAPLC